MFPLNAFVTNIVGPDQTPSFEKLLYTGLTVLQHHHPTKNPLKNKQQKNKEILLNCTAALHVLLAL